MSDSTKYQPLAIADIISGMQIRVHQKIKEMNTKGEDKERIQVFEGLVLNVRGSGVGRTMTVRKVTDGIGVERIYPVLSPIIDKLELVRKFKVSKGNISFVRNAKSRKLREVKKLA